MQNLRIRHHYFVNYSLFLAPMRINVLNFISEINLVDWIQEERKSTKKVKRKKLRERLQGKLPKSID